MLKIKRLNRKGHEVDAVIDVDKIYAIKEKERDNVPLFDADGNEAGEQVRENIYYIDFENGSRTFIPKETYEKLVAKLKVETL